MTQFKIPLVRTRSGAASLWDEGGRDETCGRAVIVTGMYGERLRPYFKYRGPTRRPNGKHALMPVYVGGYVVQTDANQVGKSVRVLQVIGLEDGAQMMDVELIASGAGDQWDEGRRPPPVLTDALKAAAHAANCRNNVEPGYIVEMAEEIV